MIFDLKAVLAAAPCAAGCATTDAPVPDGAIALRGGRGPLGFERRQLQTAIRAELDLTPLAAEDRAD